MSNINAMMLTMMVARPFNIMQYQNNFNDVDAHDKQFE